MGEYRRNALLVQDAIDKKCADLHLEPFLAQRILRDADRKGECKVKRKMYLALAFVLILLLMGSTALAVALLTPREVVDQTVLPMAEKSGSVREVPNFTQEELRTILNVAEENGIRLSEYWYNALEAPQGVYKDELIEALAVEQFGDYMTWTVEEQYWYGEVLLKLGFWEENIYCVPTGNELTYDQAYTAAVDLIRHEYGVDVSDPSRWTLAVEYSRQDFEAGVGSVEEPRWWLQFRPSSLEDGVYTVRLTKTGEVESHGGMRYPLTTRMEVDNAYRAVYGIVGQWSPAVWAAYGRHLAACEETSFSRYVAARYIDPPEGSIPLEQAHQIALDAVHLEYTEVSVAFCCMDGDRPIWKVTTHTKRPEDIGSGRYTAIWMVEMDCMTGEVLRLDEWNYGQEASLLYSPYSVAETSNQAAE